jgi:exonuclease VII large subunit
MKKTFAIFIITALAATTAMVSCESPEKKVDNAEEKVTDAKENLKDAQQNAADEAVKTASVDEWNMFKSEAELKIKNNKTRIDDLKTKMNKKGKSMDMEYENRIDSLEQRNLDLQTRMDNYEHSKTDWESFKTEFNHDMEGLGQALKDVTVNNKK